MENILSKFYLGVIVFFLCLKTNAQITISGPTCVVAGTIYQYAISGKWDSASSMQVCITAGIILNSAKSHTVCTTSGRAINKVLVVWSDSASKYGTLNLTSSSGNTSINVHFTQLLRPGTIDSSVKKQMIGFNTIPLIITCGPDSGGSCSPSYSHQWQKSKDMVSWIDIPSAKKSALTIDSPLKRSIYYRRKVTEKSSGSIDYSDVASVFVMVQPNDSVSHIDTSSAISNGRFRISKLTEDIDWPNNQNEILPVQFLWTGELESYRLSTGNEKRTEKYN